MKINKIIKNMMLFIGLAVLTILLYDSLSSFLSTQTFLILTPTTKFLIGLGGLIFLAVTGGWNIK